MMKPSKAQIEAAAEALALWDSHEPWLRDTWYQQGAEQALEAAFSVAPQLDDTALLRQALDALECEMLQTRPIDKTSDAIAALRARLDGAPQPARVPMTDEQIESCLPETIYTAEDGWLRTTAQTFHDLARAVEQWHGIRSEE